GRRTGGGRRGVVRTLPRGARPLDGRSRRLLTGRLSPGRGPRTASVRTPDLGRVPRQRGRRPARDRPAPRPRPQHPARHPATTGLTAPTETPSPTPLLHHGAPP